MKDDKKDELLKRDFDAINCDSTIPGKQRREQRRVLKRHMGKVRRKRNKIDVRNHEAISENDEFN